MANKMCVFNRISIDGHSVQADGRRTDDRSMDTIVDRDEKRVIVI